MPKGRRRASPASSRGGVVEGDVRCEEADTLTRVGVDELPNSSAQDGANKDVRIENDHLSGMHPSRGDAAP